MTEPLILIQAREGGTRFPGKIYARIQGQEMLMCVFERALKTGLQTRVVLAEQWPWIPEQDVLSRFAAFLTAFDPGERYDPIVRLTADTPLLDPGRVSAVLMAYQARQGAQLVATCPAWDGLDTEVFSRAALARAHAGATNARDREHVTPYMKEHEFWQEVALANGPLRFSVDDREGLEFVRSVYATCEYCAEGVSHRYREAPSGVNMIWDIHEVYGLHDDPRVPEPMACEAYDILQTRIGGPVYVSL